MTPDMLPLLAASLACFSVLALFARHNKRTGWVKPPRQAVHLTSDWKDYPAPVRIEVAPVPDLPQGSSLNDRTNFTLQLANFERSLAAAAPKKVAERERVTA
jgi:hypothetical protein